MELSELRRTKVHRLVCYMEKRRSCKIRLFAKFFGSLSACCPAIPYGWAYTKQFERDKFLALRRNGENYDAVMALPHRPQVYKWWKEQLLSARFFFAPPSYSMEIFSDASLSGWGAVSAGHRVHGFWSQSEKDWHINQLELFAAWLALRSFAADLRSCHILLRLDNTTAIAYINRMGGTQFPRLNKLSRQLWRWCEDRQLVVFASYVSSTDNWEADAESRLLEPETEFQLSSEAFDKIVHRFGSPAIDLFASRSNTKCRRFCSWKRDPGAEVVDTFTISWSNLQFYAFPPFSVILRLLQKIKSDGAEGIVVIPLLSLIHISEPTRPY